jgi:glutaredoxin-related protein
MKNVILGTVTVFLMAACNSAIDNNNEEITHYESCAQLLDTTKMGLYYFVPFSDFEWINTSFEEKIAKRQLPADILQKMSSKQLLYQFACGEFAANMFVYNNVQYGFRKTADQLNMLKELINRKDVVQSLLKIGNGIDKTIIECGDCTVFFECLQRVLVQQESIENASNKEASQLLTLLSQWASFIESISQKDGYLNSLSAIYLGYCNIMIKDGYEPFVVSIKADDNYYWFVDYGCNLTIEIKELIDKHLTDYLDSKK